MGVGVHHQNVIDHDADVPLPEYEVAALQAFETAGDGNTGAKLGLLHVGVAGRRNPGRLQRSLNEPRAIQANARTAAPKVRHANEALCDRHEISCMAAARRGVARVDEATAVEFEKLIVTPTRRNERVHRQMHQRRTI